MRVVPAGSDLVGRYLIKGDETVWIDGPLTQAVRGGAICYLDEVVEAVLRDLPATGERMTL